MASIVTDVSRRIVVGLLVVCALSVDVSGTTSPSCDHCSQRCSEETGQCYCLDGYVRADDGYTCNVDGDPPLLLYKVNDELRVHYLEANATHIVLHNAAELSHLAFGPQHTIYWIDSINNTVFKSKIDYYYSKEETTVVLDAGLKSPSGLCFDWSTSTLYVVDSSLGYIVACTAVEGDNCAVIHKDLPRPQDIVLNPDRRTLIWSQWGSGRNDGSIMVSWLDGSEVRALAVNLDRPTSLALDRPTNTVFWLARDGNGQQVQKMGLDSRVVKNVMKLASWCDQSTISVLTDHLYVSNGSAVITVDRQTHQTVRVLIDSPHPVTAAHIYHPVLFQTNTGDACYPSHCSGVCLPSNHHQGYSCHCPYDMYLLSGGRCASANSIDRLLVLGPNGIFQVPTEFVGVNAFRGKPLVFEKNMDCDSMVYDRGTKNVIYHDNKLMLIKELGVKHPKMVRTVYSGVKDVAGLAVDVVSDNIYWTDKKDKVYAAKHDGSLQRMITQFPDGGAHKLRGIALDPARGYMYICDWGFNPQIHRCDMDGSNCSSFITNGGHPNMIVAVQDVNGMVSILYWTDSSRNQIRYTAVNGSAIQGAVDLQMKKKPHPFGLAMTETKVFFTDLNTKQLHYIEKDNPGRVYDINLGLGPLTGLEDTSQHYGGQKTKSVGTNACSLNNGGCSHMCLPKPNNQRTCICPENVELASDQKTCGAPEEGMWSEKKNPEPEQAKQVGDAASHSKRDVIILGVFLGLAAVTVATFATIVYCYKRRKNDEEKQSLMPSTSASSLNMLSNSPSKPKEDDNSPASQSDSEREGSYDLESRPLVACPGAAVVTYTPDNPPSSGNLPNGRHPPQRPECETPELPSFLSGNPVTDTMSADTAKSPTLENFPASNDNTTSPRKNSPKSGTPSDKKPTPLGQKQSPVEKMPSYRDHMTTPPPGPVAIIPNGKNKSPVGQANTIDGHGSPPAQSGLPTQPQEPGSSAPTDNFVVNVDLGSEGSSSSDSSDSDRNKRKGSSRSGSSRDSSDEEESPQGKDILVVPLIGPSSRNKAKNKN